MMAMAMPVSIPRGQRVRRGSQSAASRTMRKSPTCPQVRCETTGISRLMALAPARAAQAPPPQRETTIHDRPRSAVREATVWPAAARAGVPMAEPESKSAPKGG